jgi:hypothetical protein
MDPMMERITVATGATEMPRAETPSRLTTTFYDLITALQDVVGANNDALVVASVVHLRRSGRLTWDGKTRTRLCSWRREDVRVMQHGASHAAKETGSSTAGVRSACPHTGHAGDNENTPNVRTVLGWYRTHVGTLEVMNPPCVRHTTGRLSLVNACPGRVCIAVPAHKEDNR